MAFAPKPVAGAGAHRGQAPAQQGGGVARSQQVATQGGDKAVRMMQHFLSNLGVALMEQRDRFAKIKNLDSIAQTLQNTQAGQVGSNQFDGKWGPNTDGAVKAAQKLADQLKKGYLSLKYDINWKRSQPEDVANAASHNTEQLKKFMLALKLNKFMPEGGETKGAMFYFDWIARASLFAEEGKDITLDEREGNKIAIVPDYIKDLPGFYNFCRQVRSSIPQGMRAQANLKELAGLIKGALVVKDPDGFIKKAQTAEQRRNTGVQSGAARDEAAAYQEGVRAGQEGTAKPRDKQEPAQYANRSWLTVAELDFCINWFIDRSFSAYTVLNNMFRAGGGKDPRTGDDVDQRAVKIAYVYNQYCQRLRQSWERIREDLLIGGNGSRLEPVQVFVDPRIFEGGGVARGQGVGRGGAGGEGFDAGGAAFERRKKAFDLSKNVIDIIYIAEQFSTSTAPLLNRMLSSGVLDLNYIEDRGNSPDDWFSTYRNPAYRNIEGPKDFARKSIEAIRKTLKDAYIKWEKDLISKGGRGETIDERKAQTNYLQQWMNALSRLVSVIGRGRDETAKPQRQRPLTPFGRPPIR